MPASRMPMHVGDGQLADGLRGRRARRDRRWPRSPRSRGPRRARRTCRRPWARSSAAISQPSARASARPRRASRSNSWPMRRAGGRREKPARKRCTRPPSWSTATSSGGCARRVDRGDQGAELRRVHVVAREQDDAADERVRSSSRSSGVRLGPRQVDHQRTETHALERRCGGAPGGGSSASDSTCAVCGNMSTTPAARVSCRARAPAPPDPAPGFPDGRKCTTPAAGARARKRRQHLARAGARRIEQHVRVARAQPGNVRRPARHRSATWNCRVADAVGGGVAARALDERGLALHAHHGLRAARERQGEVAESAEQVEHARRRRSARAAAPRAPPAPR